jgi:hypothetical protein
VRERESGGGGEREREGERQSTYSPTVAPFHHFTLQASPPSPSPRDGSTRAPSSLVAASSVGVATSTASWASGAHRTSGALWMCQVQRGQRHQCNTMACSHSLCFTHVFRLILDPPPSGVAAVAVAIFTGDSHTCVIVSGGGVKCWGGNWNGQLGIGDTTSKWSPVDVPGAARESTLMSSFHLFDAHARSDMQPHPLLHPLAPCPVRHCRGRQRHESE